MLASLRGGKAAMGKAQREHAYNVAAAVQQNAALRGRFFFLESDLNRGTVAKRDKSGKALLQVLRHLKRLTEVRTGENVRMRGVRASGAKTCPLCGGCSPRMPLALR